jgi:hypothetical protein
LLCTHSFCSFTNAHVFPGFDTNYPHVVFHDDVGDGVRGKGSGYLPATDGNARLSRCHRELA